MSHNHDTIWSSLSGKRKPYISVYDAGSQMVGHYVASWNREQREWRERRILQTQGFRPIYRINIKCKGTRDGN